MTNSKNLSFFYKPQRAFLIVSIIWGLGFLFITPPMQVSDEWNHFYRSYQVSTGQLVSEKDISGLIGGWMPEGVIVTEKSLFLNIPLSPENKDYILYKKIEDEAELKTFSAENKKIRKEVIFSLFKYPLESAFRRDFFMDFPGNVRYVPVVYMPQALGMAVGRELNLYPILLFYLGRLFALGAWVLLMYLSIRVAPLHKWVFFLLALTPTSLFQAASFSADSFTNGISFLFIAYVLKISLEGEKKIGAVGMAALFVLSTAVSLAKFYFLMPLLYFLIPYKKFSTKKRYLIFFSAMFAFILASLAVWAYLVKDLYLPLMPGVSVSRQAGFIADSPGRFLSAIAKSFSTNWLLYIGEFVGKFGHFWAFRMSSALLAVHMGMLFLVSLLDGQKEKGIGLGGKTVCLTVFLLSSFLMIITQYLSWTPVGNNEVVGIAGRYFIPIAPLFFLIFYNRWKILGEKPIGLLSVLYSTGILTYSLYTVFKNYYLASSF